jgi:hypothetical protein
MLRVFYMASLALLLAGIAPAGAQLRTFILGGNSHTWDRGGDGKDPELLNDRREVEITNTPENGIEFGHKPGWISARFFDGQENIASMVLEGRGSVKAPNSLNISTKLRNIMLKGLVSGDHATAFLRKPTILEPNMPAFGIWLILDFARPVGVKRIRFYPRNTVAETPSEPFQDDFMRGYEMWINERLTNTSAGAADVLVARVSENEEPVVELKVAPQYVRLVKLRSLTELPWEVDEIEVYGTGYLQEGTYFSDLIDLGDRGTVGPVRWVEETVGDPLFSRLGVQMRTGLDDTPIMYQVKGFDPELQREAALEVSEEDYWDAPKVDRLPIIEDEVNWSPWKSLESNALHTAPGPRRYVQFQTGFSGRLFDARELDQLRFQYLTPPVADTLRGEIFPRLAQAEEAATFRYAVRLGAGGDVLGFDQLQVETNVQAGSFRDLTIDGVPAEFRVIFSRRDAFRLSFPLINRDGAVLEFTFDLPIFRFGTAFTGTAYNSRFPTVPQRLEDGQVVDFGPGDFDEVSGLAVVIPTPQIGKLVGEISLDGRVFTPNGDGVNDAFGMFFNLLQLVAPAPVSLEIFDLAGRRVHIVADEERGLGPAALSWDGRLGDGSLVRPGNYIWVLRVRADAFEERHSGVMAVAY